MREIDNAIQIPVDSYQSATLATIKHRSDIIESVDDDDGIELTEDPFEYKPQLATTGSSMIDLIKIMDHLACNGSYGLCAKKTQTSSIQPFERNQLMFRLSIKIDETKWKSNKYGLPPRIHSVEKQSQIRQQCDQLLELGTIRHSTANE